MIYYALLYLISTTCLGTAVWLNNRTLRDLERRIQKLEETALTYDTSISSTADWSTSTLDIPIEPLPVSVKEHL